ncbi:hypothetical protein ASPZODRAFT_15904 [Penicilliopsis zonata CBS 506.65]|uniref:CRIB domain-containing protein n=1 Tax=Penicilliopsis zonata CBS 506.65 TaxID=1073090 RepID=A0A1L9SJB8_9EURO|nr:hypothetical protein ASPZODRAFT_15904 [Penicilliopsis zonata CBS 506.65]OJJ47226.1 hypothetical protein ASPZODRAFT_15904 [Penicilliopsis zonata CBS 506.65]
MTLAIRQAGSVFTGWIASCLSCLSAREGNERQQHQRALEQKGIEREMLVCHNQPHLVPPMRLVVYDSLPNSPMSPQRTPVFPSWVTEGKDRISRASSRATFPFKRRSTPVSQLRISAPTDFRHVYHSFAPAEQFEQPRQQGRFQPLQLKIHRPGNRLSELPTFENFGLDDMASLPTPPPTVISPTSETPSFWRQSSQLARKRVGSGARPSLSLRTMGQVLSRQHQQNQDHLSDPFIPHFSLRSPSSTALSEQETVSSPNRYLLGSIINHSPVSSCPTNQRRTAEAPPPVVSRPSADIYLLDRPLPPVPTEDHEPSTRPSTSEPLLSASCPSTPPRSPPSSRVAQWLFANKNNSSPHSTPPRKDSSLHSRSRTLSGSTTSSTMTCVKTTPSLYSAITAATTIHAPVGSDLDFTADVPRPLFSPVSSKQQYQAPPTVPEILDDEYMRPGQHRLQARHAAGEECYYSRYGDSAVGLAF